MKVLDLKALRKVQLMQLSILQYVDDICKNNNIPYFLSDGTLLGAVRHKGFIPWDDDIDIGITRKNYDKLIKLLENDLSTKYILQTIDSDPYYAMPFSKLILKNTKWIELGTENVKKFSGICIDIFPYDEIPTNRVLQNIQRILYKLIHRALLYKCGYYFKNRNYLNFLSSILFLFFSIRQMKSLLMKLLLHYPLMNNHTFSLYTKFGGNYFNNIQKKHVYSELSSIVFEGFSFNIPKNYDLILNKLFGNYMTLPPAEKQKPSHILMDYEL